tara:strand:- start:1385 stop:1555 length:171 start_codon:yes stop_codon:yes gene_type:complete
MKEKSQFVRLIDVFYIRPFLIFLSNKNTLSENNKRILLITGILTIIYNGRNYLKNK